MAAVVTPEVVQRIQYAVYQDVFNKRKPIPVDRKSMPWLSTTAKRKKSSGSNGGLTTVKLKKNGGLDMQFWERRDVLGFAESNFDLQLEFPFANCHVGSEVVHEDLFKMGYTIEPNGPRGKTLAKPMAEDDALRLINYFEELIEDMLDSYDVKLDIALLRDGSYDSRALVGLDGLISTSATTGTIGGKSRTNELLQHTVNTSATVTAAGTLRTKMQQTRRACNLNSRGRGGSGIDFIMCGAAFLDGYQSFATANNWQVNTNAKGTPSLDIGIPESGYEFEGIPLVWNPTFEVLDTIESASPTWTKRAYFLNSKTWEFQYMEGFDKKFSAPLDPSDQRISRLSVDGRYRLFTTVPNANGLVSIA